MLQMQATAPTEENQAAVSKDFRYSEDSALLQNTLKSTQEHVFDIDMNSASFATTTSAM